VPGDNQINIFQIMLPSPLDNNIFQFQLLTIKYNLRIATRK